MKRKYKENDLKEKIFSEIGELSKEEIKKLIDKELEKNPEDVDTDYIDTCFELMALCEENNAEKLKPQKKRNVKKALLTVAAVVVILTSVISVSAVYFNIPQEIAEWIDGKVKMKYPSENTSSAEEYKLLNSDIAKFFEECDISPVTFPEALLDENCEIIRNENLTGNRENIEFKNAEIVFKFNGESTENIMTVFQYENKAQVSGLSEISDVKNAENIKVNGMDILLFETDEACIIEYTDENTKYIIYLYSDFYKISDNAKEFVKTIK